MPQLPNVQLGNTALDISSAVNSFAKGLQEARAQRRKEQMDQAMMAIQMRKLLQPNYRQEQTFNPATGKLEYAYANELDPMDVQYTGREAKNPAFISPYYDQSGNPSQVGTQRYYQQGTTPNPTVIPNPQGMEPKGYQPMPVVVDFGQGPVTIFVDPAEAAALRSRANAGGQNAPPPQGVPTPAGTPQAQAPVQPPATPVQQPVQAPTQTPTQAPVQTPQPGQFPRAPDNLDEQKAGRAFMTIQGRYNMLEALKVDPQAYNDAAQFIAAGKVTEQLPIFGNAISEFVRSHAAFLSEPAQRYLNGIMQVGAMIAFASGGTALTRTELNAALESIVPRPGETEAMRIQRDNNLRSYLAAATRGNNAWPRFTPLLDQFNWSENDATNFTMPPQAPDPFTNNSILQGIKSRRPGARP